MVCFGRFWVSGLPFPNARRLHPSDEDLSLGTSAPWGTHFSGRTHSHGTQAPPPKSESSASKILRHSGMAVAFKATFEVFTRVGPDNSLERLTERSVGLITNRPSNVDELLVTLFE